MQYNPSASSAYLAYSRLNNPVRKDVVENPLDPESLISGRELALGYTYKNSFRKWKDEQQRLDAVSGKMTTEEILTCAPRVFRDDKIYAHTDERSI